MVGSFKIKTSTGPDVWTPVAASAVSGIVSGGEVGVDSGGPTSGTTPLVVDTATAPAQSVNGRYHLFGHVVISKTVGTDRFVLFASINGVQVNNSYEGTASQTLLTFSTSGSLVVAAGISPVLSLSLARVSGTGTATVSATTADCAMHWIFVPE